MTCSSAQTQPIIAVVDDDRQITQALGTWLQMLGMAGSFHASAESLCEALVYGVDKLQLHTENDSRTGYELAGAIIDLDLPGLDGIQLIQKLHQWQASLRLVLITAISQEKRRAYGELPPGVVCLEKPFDLDTLEQACFGHRLAANSGAVMQPLNPS